MNMPDLAVQALALTIRHLKQFGFERILGLGASFRPFSSDIEMALSANALQQLEVIEFYFIFSKKKFSAMVSYIDHVCKPRFSGNFEDVVKIEVD